MKLIMNSSKLRRLDSNERPLGYEPNELPLLHSALFCRCKSTAFFWIIKPFTNIFCLLVRSCRYKIDSKWFLPVFFSTKTHWLFTKRQIKEDSPVDSQGESLLYNIFTFIIASDGHFFMFVIKKMLYLHLVKKIEIINVLS